MSPQLWGGIECTLNRVGDTFHNQLQSSGHFDRVGDLDLIAELGLKTLRYPILWEQIQPESPDEFSWEWSDARMAHLREFGIRPIVGFLHHGSGPKWTNLLDPLFPTKLATFALAVATRYPWIDAYTPVNEPLTTARFSALYGLWYPHKKDGLSFITACLNQIEGTVRAMASVRSVNSRAQLIQTEDLAKTHGTGLLQYQVDFENERRWLTYDLLFGKVNSNHVLWNFLLYSGATEKQLNYIGEHQSIPDILGFNYYITSERFLDEAIDDYPTETQGGNDVHCYADIDAIRAAGRGEGVRSLLKEAWVRYNAPMAITEVHLGCTREEQCRWLIETWSIARQLVAEGVDLKAITAWALLGSFDWDLLVTEPRGHYEPGAFDVRSYPPRPTILAKAIRSITSENNFHHPVLDSPGWWVKERSRRQINGTPGEAQARPLLILGGRGQLGQALEIICASRGLKFQLLSHSECDICDVSDLRHAVEMYHPWAIVNASGYTDVFSAENDPQECLDVNLKGAVLIAELCAHHEIAHVNVSTNLVFDGRKPGPYFESDEPNPLNVLGSSKWESEKLISQVNPKALMVRAAVPFGPWMVCPWIKSLVKRRGLPHPQSRFSPTYLPDFCNAMLDLLIDGESGLWHLTNEGTSTAREFAELLCLHYRLPLIPEDSEFKGSAPFLPAHSILASSRGNLMPSLQNALGRFNRDCFYEQVPESPFCQTKGERDDGTDVALLASHESDRYATRS